ncbi:DUF3619 family protein [Chitinimonas arctica]|uniref:DUF3619 family protein n=1 Tax=Chitinimonas arctica TaxID=2594795 RepID=A0A516SEY9_9NEIS|nr:DUF3619 family protein [Chitinimonas arctica]QDQ26598.1 DUF3619 family protein [Chitinimonas arctica]
MSTEHFDPEKFGRTIAAQLGDGELTPSQRARLETSRQRALAHAAKPAPVRALAGLAGWPLRHPRYRKWLPYAWFALLVGVALYCWQYEPASFIDDDIDTQLLADEVPLDAWLSDRVDYLARSES